MAQPTVALSVIMRDSENFVDRFFGSIDLTQFDQVVVVDTGSVDKSIELVEKWRPKIKELKILERPWRKDFAWARQQGMDACNTDFVMWADLDDVLEGTEVIRQYLRANPHTDVFLGRYNYVFTPEGECVCRLVRERIVKKSKFRWEGRVHEVLLTDGPHTSMLIEELVNNHRPDISEEADKKRKERNLEILLEETKANPDEPRTWFYLGNAYMGVQDFEGAKKAYITYLPKSEWDLEKYQTMCRLARLFLDDGNVRKAKDMLYTAIENMPQHPIAYCVMAEIHYRKGNMDKALDFINMGLSKPVGEIFLADNPADYTYVPMTLKFQILADSGKFEEAYRWGKKIIPEIKDSGMKNKIINAMPSVEELAERDRLAQEYSHIRSYLIKNDEAEKAKSLTDSIPYTLRGTPTYKMMSANDYYNLDESQQFNEESGIKPFIEKLDVLEEVNSKARWFLNWLKDRPGIKTILDVGCNEGWFPFWLEKKGYTVVGVDANKSVIKTALEYKEQFGSSVEFYDDLSAVDGREFDLVMSFDVIEHVPNDKAFIEQLMKYAKDTLVIVTPHGCFSRGFIHDAPDGTKQHHRRVYRVRDLKRACLPYHMQTCEQIAGGHLLAAVMKKETAKRKTLALYCGATPVSWGPDSLKEGVGGSEEAVIHVSNRLQRRGWDVTIFNGGSSCVSGGVEWLPPEEFDPLDKFDVFISWRNPMVFAYESLIGISDAKKYIWLHDVPMKGAIIKRSVDKVDGIFVLSEFHKSLLPDFAQEKAIVTANGIDIDFIGPLQKKNEPHRMVWTSSYMRGLEWLLEAWPDITKEVPDAQLDICYGWQTTDANPPLPEPRYSEWRNKMNSLMDQPGIKHYGRVPQEKALELMCAAGVFPYLTLFPEISCISVMKAQACGAVPFTTNTGALDENNRAGIKMVPQLGKEEYENYNFHIQKLIELLKDESKQKELRNKCFEIADEFGWDVVIDQWEKLFRS